MMRLLLKYIYNKYHCYANRKVKYNSNNLFTRNATANYNKVFVIGMGKTGTTSLEKILIDMGFQMGNQAAGEMLINDYHNKEFGNIINYFYSAEAFQDIPSSLPGVYELAYNEFPDSKFIHTERTNSEIWYDSLVRFHSSLYTNSGNIPTEQELANSNYRYKGWSLKTKEIIFNYPNVPLYDKSYYTSIYNKHNFDIKNFFQNKKNYLNINISKPDSLDLICSFLGFTRNLEYNMPHLNRTL